MINVLDKHLFTSHMMNTLSVIN